MIVPMNSSDFDFYQSSNRMAIECAFGVLVINLQEGRGGVNRTRPCEPYFYLASVFSS